MEGIMRFTYLRRRHCLKPVSGLRRGAIAGQGYSNDKISNPYVLKNPPSFICLYIMQSACHDEKNLKKSYNWLKSLRILFNVIFAEACHGMN